MSGARTSGAAGLGFVVLLVLANAVLVAAGFPTPSDAVSVDDVTAVFAAEAGALRLASALLPSAWLLAAVFTAGAVATLWGSGSPAARTWSLVGFAGVIVQCAVFTGVEATRLALWSAATHDPAAVPGLWGLYSALFGFNQVFLATALLGLSFAASRAGASGRWHTRIGLSGAVLLFGSATASPYGIDDVNPLALLGLAGWLLWLTWIAVFSVLLLRGARPTAVVRAVGHDRLLPRAKSRPGASALHDQRGGSFDGRAGWRRGGTPKNGGNHATHGRRFPLRRPTT